MRYRWSQLLYYSLAEGVFCLDQAYGHPEAHHMETDMHHGYQHHDNQHGGHDGAAGKN